MVTTRGGGAPSAGAFSAGGFGQSRSSALGTLRVGCSAGTSGSTGTGLIAPAALRGFAASALRSGGSARPQLHRRFRAAFSTDAAAAASAAGSAAGRAASAAASAAGSAAVAAATATRAHLHASRAYLTSVRANVRHSVVQALGPYWGGGLSWSAVVMLTLARQSCGALLPGAAGFGCWAGGACAASFRQLHFYLLAAMGAMGQQHLPVALALAVVELWRSSRIAHADAAQLQFQIEETPATTGDEPGSLAWWQELPLQMAGLLENLARSLWLLLLFAPVLLTAPVALQLQWKRAEWIELLRKTLEAAGPAFIKWGQWAATRHDLFPPDMCEELEKLHTQAPAHAFRHTKAAIEAAFGVPLSELFSSIEQAPVASGSIGQIHRATLSERGAELTGMAPGTTVAIKVRHPGVGAAILRDFALMMAVAHVAAQLPSLSHLRLEQTLSQFAAPLREQVDLSREANNLRRFNHNFRKTRHVFFPVPLYPLVTPDVLVESFESGEHITSYIQAGDGNPYNHRLSELGSGTMLQMMLVDNLIHSDLHPGNILVRLDPPGGMLGLIYKGLDRLRDAPGVSSATRARIELLQQRWLQPSLVLLDVGMATELSPVDQENMVGLFRSFAAMDGRACGEWTLRFSGDSQSCPDPEAFRTAMQEAFDELHKMDLAAAGQVDSCSFKNGADALAAVLELVRQHQVSLPGHICAVVVTTLVLEGWSNKLDPDHSVLTQVQQMFEPENVPWSHRITSLVDKVMEEEANHLALA
ncbi:hypothetical protein HYH02_005725 [Chlamydomonas schloesseri]|uniref:Protein kinase domain-containing protein n=1 Tax=Chlamydomonas schloesseri TaxID=2026947 RepID=A0A836B6D6_9CHLO|nr:hypothetical protein HYH02_005725 [Chlamydomonas schloesseri]|eukprot:KAG2448971.1 hypothetical protein HYH02_005725 [Chlamydomonas schloesseri]